ncbi:large ribosomal subunit protein mL49 [Euwallacea similis]|uniref:large ribosomal subunit protein mL49 n=1 Tax=Euwallacea similis TaxID=1736056 RepID=UPI00344EEA84
MSLINKLIPLRQISILAQKVSQIRESSYLSSLQLEDIDTPSRQYETTKDPIDWQYVQQVLPPTVVPEPLKKDRYPSGWKPQVENLMDRPYCVLRTKNHMIPCYLKISNLKTKKTTFLKNIKGDIWLLEKEIREFLAPQFFQPIRTQVNEFAGYIRIHGDYVNAVKYFLEQRGY